MKNTQLIVEDIFSDIISKDSISPEQMAKTDSCFSKNNVNINIKIDFNVFKPGQEKTKSYGATVSPEVDFIK